MPSTFSHSQKQNFNRAKEVDDTLVCCLLVLVTLYPTRLCLSNWVWRAIIGRESYGMQLSCRLVGLAVSRTLVTHG